MMTPQLPAPPPRKAQKTESKVYQRHVAREVKSLTIGISNRVSSQYRTVRNYYFELYETWLVGCYVEENYDVRKALSAARPNVGDKAE
jgi:hypothetical protein